MIQVVLDPSSLLQGLGSFALVGIFFIVFIESGVLFPFLPGDSLLVAAAILAPILHLRVWWIAAIGAVAAVAGDQVGYHLGQRFGRRWFKPDARILKTSRLEKAEAFFAQHGPVALVLGRFVPVVRTYVPLAAGVSELEYRRFTRWNILGAVAWATLMTTAGALLGHVPLIANHIDMLAIVIVMVSVLPMVISGIAKHRKALQPDSV
ncbi:MAG: VTT domain-containing protein [Promicromonosporaceae bacterium]|nr:VTT domain-containing protein [Promicromonosporaceae bacterium]